MVLERGDEEAVGAVAVRQSLKEAAVGRLKAGKGFGQIDDLESGVAGHEPLHLALVLVRADRAGRVNEPAARTHRLDRGVQDARLEPAQVRHLLGALAPARVGP